jgi:Zn-dependent protease with chaperone function
MKKLIISFLFYFGFISFAYAEFYLWDINKLSGISSPALNLVANGQIKGQINKEKIRNIVEVKNKLSAINGVNVPIYIRSDSEVNAFAFEYPNQMPFIGLTLGMINSFGEDPDVMASVLAHEMAHIHQHHVLNKMNRQQTIATIGSVLSVIIDAKTGNNIAANTIDKLAIDVISGIASMKFTRDEESEADSYGFEWVVESGYKVEGAIKLFSYLESHYGDGVSFLQDHPVNSERIEKAKNYALRINSNSKDKNSSLENITLKDQDCLLSKKKPSPKNCTSKPRNNNPIPANDSWKYKYENKDLYGNINHKGTVLIKLSKDDLGGEFETASFELINDSSISKFETRHKIQSGNVLYELTNEQTRQSFIQFSPYKNRNLENSLILDRQSPLTNFPVYSSYNDQAWVFNSQIIGLDLQTIKGVNVAATKIALNGFRPTGPGHCYYGQPGQIKIESWYEKDTKRFVKQVVTQYHCMVDAGKVLSQETYELIE